MRNLKVGKYIYFLTINYEIISGRKTYTLDDRMDKITKVTKDGLFKIDDPDFCDEYYSNDEEIMEVVFIK